MYAYILLVSLNLFVKFNYNLLEILVNYVARRVVRLIWQVAGDERIRHVIQFSHMKQRNRSEVTPLVTVAL